MIVLDASMLVSAAIGRGSNSFAIFFRPTVSVTDCRDAKDDKYLELALAAGATTIVSSDGDLLVLHPWRGVRILLPAGYLAETAGRG